MEPSKLFSEDQRLKIVLTLGPASANRILTLSENLISSGYMNKASGILFLYSLINLKQFKNKSFSFIQIGGSIVHALIIKALN